MEKIINPELQHLAENIFLNLNAKDLKACQLINRSANQILDNNPIFWAKKYIAKGLSMEMCEDLIKVQVIGTVVFTANNLKFFSSHDFSLRATWAGHWLLG